MVDLLTFVNEHPINESSIKAALAREGKKVEKLVPSDLFPYDQDHYGGLQAVKELAEKAGFSANSVVLDVCSGMGGPARYISDCYGCSVVGLDVNKSRTLSAARLTRWVDLGNTVSFVCGDAGIMPLGQNAFTHVVSQEGFLHIEDKGALFRNCREVLRPEGRMVFTDWIASPNLSSHERNILRDGMAAVGVHTEDEYKNYIFEAGFDSLETEDLSSWWAKILPERFKMYQSKSKEAGEAFGLSRFEEFINAYGTFIRVLEAGKLGGMRFTVGSL